MIFKYKMMVLTFVVSFDYFQPSIFYTKTSLENCQAICCLIRKVLTICVLNYEKTTYFLND